MNIFAVFCMVLGVSLALCSRMLIVHRHRIGELMVAVGVGNALGNARPPRVAAYLGVVQAVLGIALVVYGIVIQIHSGSPGAEKLNYFALAFIILPVTIAYASLGGGSVGIARERASRDAQSDGSDESNSQMDGMAWRESLRSGGAAFLIANGVLALLTTIWLLVMFLPVYGNQ